MLEWFARGGWIMGFLLVTGGLSIAAAAGFARRPDAAKLPRLGALSRAVAWATATGVAADVAAVGIKIPHTPEWAHGPDLALLVLEGVGESMSPAMLGGAVLSIVALLTAAGHGRLRALGTSP